MEIFPTTNATWLEQTLVVDPRAAREHVLARYAAPLTIYARASSLRLLGEPDELVHEFLASRLDDPSYLERWRASGLPLRRWLASGLIAHARDRAATEARRRRALGTVDPADLNRVAADAGTHDALLALERAWAMRVMLEAQDTVRTELDSEGRGAWWDLFRMHSVQGVPYEQACAATGVAPGSASHVNRVVARRLRDTLAAMLGRDGIPPDEIERELSLMQDLLG
jgi:hypothetical protein